MGKDIDCIRIKIEDNGCGISKQIVQEINQGIFRKTDDKNHIGMENAITRIYMYYGEDAKVYVESRVNQGTTIQIRIPLMEDETAI